MLSEWRIRFMGAHIANGNAIEQLRVEIDAYVSEASTEEEGDYKELLLTEIKILKKALSDMESAHAHLDNATS